MTRRQNGGQQIVLSLYDLTTIGSATWRQKEDSRTMTNIIGLDFHRENNIVMTYVLTLKGRATCHDKALYDMTS